MKNKNRLFTKIIVITVIVSILSIGLINLIVGIENPCAVQDNDWIGFYGTFVSSIIAGLAGGYITYEGVKLTIKDNEENRNLQQKLSIRPAFQISMRDTQGFFEENEENLKYPFNFHDTIEAPVIDVVNIFICLLVENVGGGYATHMRFRTFIDGEENLKQSEFCFLTLGVGKKVQYYINGINMKDSDAEKNIKVLIECKDMLLNDYSQEMTIQVKGYQSKMISCGTIAETKNN